MPRRPNRASSFLVLALLSALSGALPASTFAQGGTGQIEGIARDEQGAVVPGATLHLDAAASAGTTLEDAQANAPGVLSGDGIASISDAVRLEIVSVDRLGPDLKVVADVHGDH